MKHFLPLIILTGLLFGQDVLILKSGEFYKVVKLELSDGLVLIRYGTKVDSDYKRISPEAQFVRNCILGAAGCYLLAYLLIMSSAAQIDISTGM